MRRMVLFACYGRKVLSAVIESVSISVMSHEVFITRDAQNFPVHVN
jgi:hypothetical protein